MDHWVSRDGVRFHVWEKTGRKLLNVVFSQGASPLACEVNRRPPDSKTAPVANITQGDPWIPTLNEPLYGWLKSQVGRARYPSMGMSATGASPWARLSR